jgi:hypothetical protein
VPFGHAIGCPSQLLNLQLPVAGQRSKQLASRAHSTLSQALDSVQSTVHVLFGAHFAAQSSLPEQLSSQTVPALHSVLQPLAEMQSTVQSEPALQSVLHSSADVQFTSQLDPSPHWSSHFDSRQSIAQVLSAGHASLQSSPGPQLI